jgi:Holliday junction resolvase RusA-like endonuclease
MFEKTSLGLMPVWAATPPKVVRFSVHGEPKTKGRPRFSRTGKAYTPKETLEAEKVIRDAFIEAAGDVTFTNNVGIECAFFVGTKRRKDIDNMVKLVQDALNGVGFGDDSQINVEMAARFYSTPGQARSLITVFESIDVVES